jgi:hypothetical protein
MTRDRDSEAVFVACSLYDQADRVRRMRGGIEHQTTPALLHRLAELGAECGTIAEELRRRLPLAQHPPRTTCSP